MLNSRKLYSFIAIFVSIYIIFNANLSIKNNTFDQKIFYDKKLNGQKHYNPDYVKLLTIFVDRSLINLNGWKQLDFNNDNTPDFCENKNTGFEGTSFIKNNEIVIVIRGMHYVKVENVDIFKDKDGQNAKEIFLGNLGCPLLGKIPDQFYDAMNHIDYVKSKYPDKKIILVGKSLGGAIVQLAGAVNGFETYTFAAPGAKYALSKLDSKYNKSIKKNSKRNFSYIKNYYNLNDPCGNYGEHIGLSFVHPPKSIKNLPFYDIHGNTNHFANMEAVNRLIPVPLGWNYRHTAALVYYDENLTENLKPISLHKFIKLRYQIQEQDLLEALEMINISYQKNNLPCQYKIEKGKLIMSNFKLSVK